MLDSNICCFQHISHITFLSSSTLAATCSGWSTPQMGHVPFFYVKCQNTTYFGPDPYYFSPNFGSRFPGHGNKADGLLVRSYVCNGSDSSVQPTWKMMGFFPVNNCASLLEESYTYDKSVCNSNLTSAPTLINPLANTSKLPTTSIPTATSPSTSNMVWYVYVIQFQCIPIVKAWFGWFKLSSWTNLVQ